MVTFAERFEETAENANNSREELLSLEAMEEKVDALRQQVSQETQSASAAADASVLVPQTTLQAEPAIEIVDQITNMFIEGGMSAKLMAETFGDQLTGVIGEMMRNEIKYEKHQKKLEELAAIIEVSRQQNLNVQNAAVQSQNIAQLDSQRLNSQLTSAFQAMSQVDVSLRASLNSLQAEQSRISEISRLQQSPNLLQQAQQAQTQIANRFNQAAELQIQNISSARQLSEVLTRNNAGENVIQLSQTAQNIIKTAIEQATARQESATVRGEQATLNNPAINNPAIKDSIAKLEALNTELQRMSQRGSENQSLANNANLIAERANAANALNLNKPLQQQFERAHVQGEQKASQEAVVKQTTAQQLAVKADAAKADKLEKTVKAAEVKEEVKSKLAEKENQPSPEPKKLAGRVLEDKTSPLFSNAIPDLDKIVRDSGKGLRGAPPTNPASPSGCGGCTGEKGCPGCPLSGVAVKASFRQNSAAKGVGG